MTQVQILPPAAKFLKKLHGRNQRKFLRGIKALYAHYITVHICIIR
jgi:mRNA-degrading endonuclease RelE of RelBE toxin-antitoxin system